MCIGDDCTPENPQRRTFLAGTAATLIALAANKIKGQEPPPTRVLNNPHITHGNVTFARGKGNMDGYLARPKRKGRHPVVLVIAGNRITEEYIPNTCAALAVAGFVGLAPNIYHTLPESARTVEEINKALAGRTDQDYLNDVRAGADYLRKQSFVKAGPVGLVGFCVGGHRAMLYANRYHDVGAVVAYHPGKTEPNEIARLKAPVCFHIGTSDRQVSVSSIVTLENTLKAQRVTVETYIYDGVDHGFLAYTRPSYSADDAVLSWRRTIEFLRQYLKT